MGHRPCIPPVCLLPGRGPAQPATSACPAPRPAMPPSFVRAAGGAARLLAGLGQPLGDPPPRDAVQVGRIGAGDGRDPRVLGSPGWPSPSPPSYSLVPRQHPALRLPAICSARGLHCPAFFPGASSLQGWVLRRAQGRQVGARRGGGGRGLRCAHPWLRHQDLQASPCFRGRLSFFAAAAGCLLQSGGSTSSWQEAQESHKSRSLHAACCTPGLQTSRAGPSPPLQQPAAVGCTALQRV